MTTVYLVAIAFGFTLLVGSLLLGGKDTDHDSVDSGGLAWAPIGSMRFWVFFLAFGGAAGYALTRLQASELVAGLAAAGIGWMSGMLAVLAVRAAAGQGEGSAGVEAKELVGSTGLLLLPAGKDRVGKMRIELGGKAEDYVVTLVDDGVELPSGTPVLVVAEGERGTLLVAKADV